MWSNMGGLRNHGGRGGKGVRNEKGERLGYSRGTMYFLIFV